VEWRLCLVLSHHAISTPFGAYPPLFELPEGKDWRVSMRVVRPYSMWFVTEHSQVLACYCLHSRNLLFTRDISIASATSQTGLSSAGRRCFSKPARPEAILLRKRKSKQAFGGSLGIHSAPPGNGVGYTVRAPLNAASLTFYACLTHRQYTGCLQLLFARGCRTGDWKLRTMSNTSVPRISAEIAKQLLAHKDAEVCRRLRVCCCFTFMLPGFIIGTRTCASICTSDFDDCLCFSQAKLSALMAEGCAKAEAMPVVLEFFMQIASRTPLSSRFPGVRKFFKQNEWQLSDGLQDNDLSCVSIFKLFTCFGFAPIFVR
jgi:hypothetical protein